MSTFVDNVAVAFGQAFAEKALPSRPNGTELLRIAPSPRLALMDVRADRPVFRVLLTDD